MSKKEEVNEKSKYIRQLRIPISIPAVKKVLKPRADSKKAEIPSPVTYYWTAFCVVSGESSTNASIKPLRIAIASIDRFAYRSENFCDVLRDYAFTKTQEMHSSFICCGFRLDKLFDMGTTKHSDVVPMAKRSKAKPKWRCDVVYCLFDSARPPQSHSTKVFHCMLRSKFSPGTDEFEEFFLDGVMGVKRQGPKAFITDILISENV